MAIKNWIGGDGASQTDYEDANRAANWSPAGVPVQGDTLIFGAAAGADSTTGEKYNCVVTSWAALPLQFADIVVSPAYSGDGADVTDKLQCNVNDDGRVVFEGTGVFYIEMTTANVKDGAAETVVNGTGTLNMSSDDTAADDNDWGDVFVYNGTVNMANDTIFDKLYCLGSSAIVLSGRDCKDVGGNDVEITQNAGTINWNSQLGTICRLFGTATFNWGTTAYDDTYTEAMQCDLVEGYGDSVTFNWNLVDTTYLNTLKQFKFYDKAVVDASAAVGAAGPKEIGSAGAEVSELWYEAEGKFDNGAKNITVHASSSIMTYGGKPTPPDGESISW